MYSPSVSSSPGEARAPSLLVVCGLSGAGKSTVLQVLEDLDFFTADGLPPSLIPECCRMFSRPGMEHFRGMALGVDFRRGGTAKDLDAALNNMEKRIPREGGASARPALLFLEASPDVILRRYATTRRPHPLEREGMGLEEAMREERRRLVKVRDSADIVLDTSRFTLHDLRREIQRRWSETETAGHAMRVNLISFGFKYGVPSEADMVFDLRCLPNPYFVEELRPLTGQNRAVADYVFAGEAARAFRERFLDFLRFALPYYDAEGRYRLTIGLGCTGGRHRSVAMTEAAAKALRQDGYVVGVEHRHSSLDHFQNENAPTERVQKTQGSAVAD